MINQCNIIHAKIINNNIVYGSDEETKDITVELSIRNQ